MFTINLFQNIFGCGTFPSSTISGSRLLEGRASFLCAHSTCRLYDMWSQPEDWDDNEFIPDPEDHKPEVWFCFRTAIIFMVVLVYCLFSHLDVLQLGLCLWYNYAFYLGSACRCEFTPFWCRGMTQYQRKSQILMLRRCVIFALNHLSLKVISLHRWSGEGVESM